MVINAWEGMQGYEEGDRVELCNDADEGSLMAKKNGRVLGTAAKPGTLPVGAKLCWAVAVAGQGAAVRVESTDPRRFARELEWEWDLAGNHAGRRQQAALFPV